MSNIVNIGKIKIGGGNRIAVQSMTNADTKDFEALKNQTDALISAGCDIVRIAVSDDEEIDVCKRLIKQTDVPLVADIQFDYKLAIKCADIGFSKIRFNPGNIGSEIKVRELAAACKKNKIPVRVGANFGSLSKSAVEKYGRTAEALAVSALENVAILEKAGFYDIVVSVKASDVKIMIDSNRKIAKNCNYPLHIGVTESGSSEYGLVKSAIGCGALLTDSIGDTIRVSLTGDPVQEIGAAKMILRAAGLDKNFCEIISCPTCSRCKYNLENVLDSVKKLTKDVKSPLKIAVMGCVVNGPGEAKDADIGVAGGKDKSVIFKKGEVIATVKNEDVVNFLDKTIKEMI